MKVRLGHVSNSSSSSFVVISDLSPIYSLVGENGVLFLYEGDVDFSRNLKDLHDSIDKLNFALALAWAWDNVEEHETYLEPYWMEHDPSQYTNLVEMVRRVVKYQTGLDMVILHNPHDEDYDLVNPWNNPLYTLPSHLKKDLENEEIYFDYINLDHNTHPCQAPENLVIFKDNDHLARFLFSEGSIACIRGDDENFHVKDLLPHQTTSLKWRVMSDS